MSWACKRVIIYVLYIENKIWQRKIEWNLAREQKEELREMGKNKIQSQSVLGGTLILLIANLAVKIIGAGFKIPLTNLIGDHGMGYFNSGYSVYAGVFIIATAGLPVAVSRMVSESMALGRLKETKRIFLSPT